MVPMETSIGSTDVIILCGGLGTRLRSAFDGPKALAPVGDRSFLDLLFEFAGDQGIRRFILCVGHKAEQIEARYRSDSSRTIVYSREETPLGTAGALKLCQRLRQSPVSIVMNGDSFCSVDLGSMLRAHHQLEAMATIALTPAQGRADGGNIVMDANGRIAAFAEKTKTSGARYINAGIYVTDDRLFEIIPSDRPSSLEKDIFPGLADKSLFGFAVDGPLYDIGTPERLESFRAGWKK